MSVEPTTLPDPLPTTRVIETTSTQHDIGGTHDEVVQNMLSLGWEVSEEPEECTILRHPLITGTSRYILKK